jgi:hypothetical protein
MVPKGAQEIEIEKTHGDPLPSLNQAVTGNYANFLGTALNADLEVFLSHLGAKG